MMLQLNNLENKLTLEKKELKQPSILNLFLLKCSKAKSWISAKVWKKNKYLKIYLIGSRHNICIKLAQWPITI